MKIFIPTYRRPYRQITYTNLPPIIQEQTTLVVDSSEANSHGKKNVWVLPDGIQGRIGRVRQHIVDEFPNEKIVMMDDDLRFYARRNDDRTKLRQPTSDDIVQMFSAIESSLNTAPFVGIASREGANRNTDHVLINTRIMRLLAYDTKKIHEHKIQFDRLQVMEDFDVAIQLLRAGQINIVLNDFAHNQDGSDASGGCSTYRTEMIQAQAAQGLKELHPDFVKVVEKKSWSGVGTRLDVQIAWKKAFDSRK